MMSASSRLAPPARSPSSPGAAFTAVSSACASSAGSPVDARPATCVDSTTTWPTANPGEARRPLRRMSATRFLQRSLFLLIETPLDEFDDRCHGGGRVGAAGTDVQYGPLRSLDAHDFDRALGIDPGPVRRKRHVEVGGKRLGELSQFNRRPRMQTDRIGEFGAGGHETF